MIVNLIPDGAASGSRGGVYSFNDGGPRLDLHEDRQDANAYLIIDDADTGDVEELVESYWEEIFESELNAWMRDPSVWPSNRSLKMFWEWFEVIFAALVFDLCEDQLET